MTKGKKPEFNIERRKDEWDRAFAETSNRLKKGKTPYQVDLSGWAIERPAKMEDAGAARAETPPASSSRASEGKVAESASPSNRESAAAAAGFSAAHLVKPPRRRSFMEIVGKKSRASAKARRQVAEVVARGARSLRSVESMPPSRSHAGLRRAKQAVRNGPRIAGAGAVAVLAILAATAFAIQRPMLIKETFTADSARDSEGAATAQSETSSEIEGAGAEVMGAALGGLGGGNGAAGNNGSGEIQAALAAEQDDRATVLMPPPSPAPPAPAMIPPTATTPQLGTAAFATGDIDADATQLSALPPADADRRILENEPASEGESAIGQARDDQAPSAGFSLPTTSEVAIPTPRPALAETQIATAGTTQQAAAPPETPDPAIESEPAAESTSAPAQRQPQASEMVKRIQLALAEHGIDPGPVDGLRGPRTREAAREFQRRVGAAPNGEIDAELLRRLESEPVRRETQTASQGSAATSSGEEEGSGAFSALIDSFGSLFDFSRPDDTGMRRNAVVRGGGDAGGTAEASGEADGGASEASGGTGAEGTGSDAGPGGASGSGTGTGSSGGGSGSSGGGSGGGSAGASGGNSSNGGGAGASAGAEASGNAGGNGGGGASAGAGASGNAGGNGGGGASAGAGASGNAGGNGGGGASAGAGAGGNGGDGDGGDGGGD